MEWAFYGILARPIRFFGKKIVFKLLSFILQVEVADPKHKTVKLGAVRVGQTVKRSIPIVNKSPASISFRLGFTPSTSALQDKGVLKYHPQEEITLEGKGGTAKVN